MSWLQILAAPASGLRAASVRMSVIAENLANAEATQTPEGGPYRRRVVQLASQPLGEPGAGRQGRQVAGVSVQGIVETAEPLRRVYEPGHPDADAEGYVLMPNVELPLEMVDLTVASRVYQANLAALQTLRKSLRETVDLLG